MVINIVCIETLTQDMIQLLLKGVKLSDSDRPPEKKRGEPEMPKCIR